MTNPLKNQSIINLGVDVGQYFLEFALMKKPVCSRLRTMDRESGKLRDKRRIQRGRARVRTVLYRATLSAIQCNPVTQSLYKRLVNQGKHKKVAITACMCKFWVMLNAMVRDQKPWCHE